jgi:hypothetical protein
MSDADYPAAWRELRRRRRFLWVLFLGYIPGVAALCFLVWLAVTMTAGSKQGEVACAIIALLWILAFAAAAIRLTLFRCPRCHRLFHSTWWRHNPFSHNCLHCGLAQGTDTK